MKCTTVWGHGFNQLRNAQLALERDLARQVIDDPDNANVVSNSEESNEGLHIQAANPIVALLWSLGRVRYLYIDQVAQRSNEELT